MKHLKIRGVTEVLSQVKEGQFVLCYLSKDLKNMLKYVWKIIKEDYLGTEKVHT